MKEIAEVKFNPFTLEIVKKMVKVNKYTGEEQT